MPLFRHGSIFTKRQKMRGARKDGGGKQRKRRRVYATVTDLIFGTKPPSGMLPQVPCPVPRTKHQKYCLGSPFKHLHPQN